MDNIAVVIAAAGRGERAGGGVPKQYRALAGRPILAWSVSALMQCGGLGPLQVVIDSEHEALYREAVSSFRLPRAVQGGATRQESVLNGLRALRASKPDYVMIHDAARPFVSSRLVDRLRGELSKGVQAVVPVLPLADTVKSISGNTVTGTLDRRQLVRAQTPQAFRYADILEAHEAAERRDCTDDAAVAEAAGLAVVTVIGEEANVKMTTTDDLERARASLERMETRVGSGFDAHALVRGDHVTLCGVRIGHDRSLAGDTDADVGLHALIDAIFGALGEGDLGSHFPPGDPAWKGRASVDLLGVALGHVERRRARLVNVDITLICEKPRLAAYQGAMKMRVAALLGIEPPRVNVKATSTDRLGFAGRGEGIAAQTVVTLMCPVP